MRQLDNTKVKVELNWRPFELDASTPMVSTNKMERYYAKFGKPACDQMLPRMKTVGNEYGINFSYGGLIGNTFNSHRLVQYAKDKGKQDEMMEVLFRYYFEQEKDINNIQTLATAAQEANVGTIEEVTKFLKTNELADMVRKDVEESYQEGCTGVPYFIVTSQVESPSYSTEMLVQMKPRQLKDILKQRKQNTADCVEKQDFIDLVLKTNHSAAPRTSRHTMSGAQDAEAWMDVFRTLQVA